MLAVTGFWSRPPPRCDRATHSPSATYQCALSSQARAIDDCAPWTRLSGSTPAENGQAFRQRREAGDAPQSVASLVSRSARNHFALCPERITTDSIDSR
jgi:hypothetical protein